MSIRHSMLRCVRITSSAWLLSASLGCAGLASGPTSLAADDKAAAQGATDKPDTAPDATKPSAPAKVELFANVMAEWTANDDRMKAIAAKFPESSPDDREKLRQEYMGFVEKAKQMMPRLRAAALDAYLQKPNEQPEVTRTLLGLLNNDVQSDDYSNGYQLAKVLLDKKCPEKILSLFAGYAAYGANDFTAAESLFKQAKESGVLDPEGESLLEGMAETQAAWKVESGLREKEAKADDLPRVRITTNRGPIVIELYENQAPQTVGNFISLVEKKYYDGLTFHRVLGGFMAQGGCPTGDGTGGPGYEILCECYRDDYRHHFTGTLSMAHAGKDTGGSQFFLTFRPTPHLDGRHTAFGRVIEGLDVLPKLQRRDPQRSRAEPDKIIKAEVIRKRDHVYEPTKSK